LGCVEYEFNLATSQEWDDFVSSHPQGNIFQTRFLFEVYANTPNYSPVRISLTNTKTGKVVGVISGVVIHEIKGIARCLSSHAVIQGGPLVVGEDPIQLSKLLVAKFDQTIRKKAIYSEIRNMDNQSALKDQLNGYEFVDHLNFVLNLERPLDDLWKGLHRNRRTNIKKGEANGVHVEEITSAAKIDEYYQLIAETYDEVGLPEPPKELFVNAFSQLGPLGHAKFFGAFHDDKCIGIRADLLFNGRIYDWYAGSSKANLSHYPNDCIVWHIIKWGKENGYKVFDFGGAGNPNKPYGPREFKRRFGGEMISPGRYLRTYSPIKYKLATHGLELYTKVKKSPISDSNKQEPKNNAE
jgi:serine/alanine adding enzyme